VQVWRQPGTPKPWLDILWDMKPFPSGCGLYFNQGVGESSPDAPRLGLRVMTCPGIVGPTGAVYSTWTQSVGSGYDRAELPTDARFGAPDRVLSPHRLRDQFREVRSQRRAHFNLRYSAMCDELRFRDSPSIRFSTGLTPERYSSSAWYTARETWNVCYRFIRARGAPSAWGTLFWGLAHPFNHLNSVGAPQKFERSKRASPRTVYVNGIGIGTT
jgi:hypothetical protein